MGNYYRWFSICLMLTALLTGCSGRAAWEPEKYEVRRGDTLYGIAWRYQLNHHDLAKWNNIAPPYQVKVGQKLILQNPTKIRGYQAKTSPVTTSKTRSKAPKPTQTNKTPTKSVPTKSAPTKSSPTKSTGKQTATRPQPAEPTAQKAPSIWLWPTTGEVVKKFMGPKSASTGIDIRGELNQKVIASAAGRVVYSGSGLAGYGNLVIIKHNEEFLSAYAHNNKLLVREGDEVTQGQTIAHMGLIDNTQPQLHFEIRYLGKPVDPLEYLPKNSR